ncbi:cytochrome b/b6 domain-containing protein [Myxococcota bacterium]
MNRILVWDVPTRVFHWLFTSATVAAMGIAAIADDDGPTFQVHMLFGLIAGFTVIMRLFWGVVGSKHARFGSFLFGPKALIDYVRGAIRRNAARHLGHNPGSAYVVYVMLLLTLGLAFSGLLMSTSKALEEAHEVMAHLLPLIAIAHVAGIVWHTFRHRENIALSMIDGKKEGESSLAISSSHVGIGAVFLVLTLGWTAVVFGGHDEHSGQLNLFGATFLLGESEHDQSAEHDDDDDDDDDDHNPRERRRGKRGHHGKSDHHDDHDKDDD